MKCIYIGDHFYMESGTMMSCIYEENGNRADWARVKVALRNGENVEIRPANQIEQDHYEAQLSRYKREREKDAT